MPDILISLWILFHLLARLAQDEGMASKTVKGPAHGGVTHAPAKRPLSNTERQAAYRARHGDRRRARHAEYMRGWRKRRRLASAGG